MLKEFRFHHIGVATSNIDASAFFYEQGGYHRSETIFDPIQNVNICWLTKEGMPTIELLAPIDDSSPVNAYLKKNGVIPYHTCYIVDNLEDTSMKLRLQHYVVVSKPAEAVAFCGSRVAFFYNRDVGLIELVETPAIIVK